MSQQVLEQCGRASGNEGEQGDSKDDSVSDRAKGTSKADGKGRARANDQGELDCAINDTKICMKYLWCRCYFLDFENVYVFMCVKHL